jgi:hypothetical protein
VHTPMHAQRAPTAMQNATVAGVNVAIGAGTSTLRALIGKRPVWPALWQGAVGGGVMAGGMLIGDAGSMSTRVARVQLVSLGASMARNAGAGDPLLSRVTLPLFPLMLDVDLRGKRTRRYWPLRVRVSGTGVAGIVTRLATSDGYRVDWRETVASGYIVFRTTSAAYGPSRFCPTGFDCVRAGDYFLGTGAYVDGRDAAAIRATLDHEAVHAAQHARDAVLFGVPTSEALLQRSGRLGRWLDQVLVLDFVLPLSALSIATGEARGSHHDAWYELEARTVAPGSAGQFEPPR